MRVFVTGGGGFVGRRVVAGLLARGDTVVAAVRDPDRASDLRTAGATVIADELSDTARLTDHLQGADAAVHIAGMYRVGIRASERPAMWDANVGTTTRILEAAEAARVPRIVYVSTVNAFGNTRGEVADEWWQRDLAAGFLSWYDETKYRAHEVAEERSRAGAPIVIVLPSQVYGRGDHSGFGEQMRLANEGRLPYRALDAVGVGLVHVDDLADGILAVLDRGRIGESYVLSGPRTTLGEAVTLAAGLAGRRPPRLRLPMGLLRLMAPVGGLIGQPNLREVISASDGVTYWASSTKAERELAFRPRSIEAGLRDTFGVR
ncbi:MAG: NAD-dependent epimerase/dehydratase family protein [Chloroflexota bacterium]|nr:NAD-dependent epimerase/dehydratase family protein [Chloroflexota bacterium]